MVTNKTARTAAPANAKSNARLLAARKTALSSVRTAAFQSGTSRNAVIAATFAACGAKPVLALYQAARLELQVGFMAAALARKGDNREGVALMDHCRSRLTEYAGFGGTGKLPGAMKGRRTKDEEAAYGSARVLTSGIMKEANVTVPEARGGDTSKTRAPGGKVAAGKAKPGAKASTDSKPAVRRFKDKAPLIAHCQTLAQAMLANVDRNAAIAPIELKSAVQDIVTRIKALVA